MGLMAPGIADKRRINQPVLPFGVQNQQSAYLQVYFLVRIKYYHNESANYPQGNDPVDQKETTE